ncbi:MAG: hypothetical protein PUK59_00320 [Actinomycetaceae bacterium]|nr:hypothetical protein [Actinomycetaceae bacterium]
MVPRGFSSALAGIAPTGVTSPTATTDNTHAQLSAILISLRVSGFVGLFVSAFVGGFASLFVNLFVSLRVSGFVSVFVSKFVREFVSPLPCFMSDFNLHL